jgi:hypothetical protein
MALKMCYNKLAVHILVVVFLLFACQSIVTVADDTDDNFSTYDSSEEDTFMLQSSSKDDIKSRHQPFLQVNSRSRNSDFITQAEQHQTTESSGKISPRTENGQVTFDPTLQPHVKSRSRSARRQENRRTTHKKPNDLQKSSRSKSKDDLDLPGDKEGLTYVVLELRDQLRESQTLQTVTR